MKSSMGNKLFYICGFMILLASSCSSVPEGLPPSEYLKWSKSEESHWTKKQDAGPYNFILQYKSPELIAIRQLCRDDNGCETKMEEMETIKNSYEKMLSFNFDIVSKNNESFLNTNLESENEKYERLNYFVSYAQDNFKLINGGDTIRCSVYHFEQTYGASPFNTISLAFPKPVDTTKDLQFVFDDQILGVGKINYKFSPEQIYISPKIKYN